MSVHAPLSPITPAWLPQGGGHNAGIHGLRGVAAAMVLFAHIIGGTAEHVYSASPGYLAVAEPLWNFGTFFVYLFFAISGYVILPSAFRYSPGDFAFRRMVRIYPLFLACSLVFIVGNLIWNLEPEVNNPTAIFHALTFTNLLVGAKQLTPNAWSLSYEMMFYALAAAGAYAVLQRRFGLGLVVAVASAAFVALYPKAIYFTVGIMVFAMNSEGMTRKIPLRPLAELAAAIGLAVAASQSHFDFHPGELSQPITLTCLTLTGIYFLLAVEPDSLTARALSARWAQYLGTISYSLYLVHPYVYMPMRVLFQRFDLFGDNVVLSVAIFGTVTALASVALAQFSFVIFEKFPQNLAKSWAKRPKFIQKETRP
ncbi:acyltransferase family protein [Aliiroseovarius sp. CAU 1755]